MYRGDLSVLRVARLTAQLKPGSRIYTGADAEWNVESQLLAAVADILNAANYQRGGAKGSKPKPLPRPPQLKAEADKKDRTHRNAQEAARRLRKSSD